MYKFIDTNEASDSVILPSEALKINGKYIENLIPGYRTLSVSGREALSPELDFYETGIRDGSTLKSRRYPARTIIVAYQIIAESNEAFRAAYNKLGGILNIEDAELIFNDETDKYYIGTPSAIGEVEPGRNAVTGEFEIFCADPFKYSVEEYEVEPVSTMTVNAQGDSALDTAFIFEYNGTHKSFPTIKADFYAEDETDNLTGNGDCGFVAFINERGKILQFGDPEETHGDYFEKSQTVVSHSFKSSYSWGESAQALWAENEGITVDATAQVGSVNVIDAQDILNDDRYLTPLSYGEGDKWHGASVTRTIPADASGKVGANNFTLTYAQKMAISGHNTSGQREYGAFSALLVSGSGSARKIVAGVNIYKGSVGKKGVLCFLINGEVVEETEIDLSLNNSYFGHDEDNEPIRTSMIRKMGDTVTFNIGNVKKSYTLEALADMTVNEITFVFSAYGTAPALGYNGLFYAKFVKENCETFRNIPNKFGANDVLIADCRKGKVFLNNAETPEYGAIGNDWEEFYLHPGENFIGVAFSDFVSIDCAPSFKLRYREVFL